MEDGDDDSKTPTPIVAVDEDEIHFQEAQSRARRKTKRLELHQPHDGTAKTVNRLSFKVKLLTPARQKAVILKHGDIRSEETR